MSASAEKTRGMGMVKVLLLIPLALLGILVLTFGFYEARKAYWDYQVDRLCEMDGGVKINQVMLVNAQQYEELKNKFGELAPSFTNEPDRAKGVVFLSDSTTYIKASNPTVAKYVLSITRRTDKVVLATRTSYWRNDGDLISMQPSSHFCPIRTTDFFQAVIKLQGKNK